MKKGKIFLILAAIVISLSFSCANGGDGGDDKGGGVTQTTTPVIGITNPVNLVKIPVGDLIRIEVDIDNLDCVDSVEVLIDNVSIGFIPWGTQNYIEIPNNLAPGWHQILVIITDCQGNQYTRTINFESISTGQTGVVITSPAIGQNILRFVNFNIVAQIFNIDCLNNVEVFIDDISKGTVTAAPYQLNIVNNLTLGVHYVDVIATACDGATYSDSVNFDIVDGSTDHPTIAMTTEFLSGYDHITKWSVNGTPGEERVWAEIDNSTGSANPNKVNATLSVPDHAYVYGQKYDGHPLKCTDPAFDVKIGKPFFIVQLHFDPKIHYAGCPDGCDIPDIPFQNGTTNFVYNGYDQNIIKKPVFISNETGVMLEFCTADNLKKGGNFWVFPDNDYFVVGDNAFRE